MVAHGRDNDAICKHLGADGIVFQTLKDVTEACADVAKAQGLDGPGEFEVGVFCGRYITPVSEGYIDQLHQNRGKNRVLKAS
jgi:amidophosphoribosyltransferase